VDNKTNKESAGLNKEEARTAATATESVVTILDHLIPKPREISLVVIKLLYITVAATWAVTNGIP
jgi:hypothetical protein